MTKKLAEVYESGIAVQESVADEWARLTAEVADLERQYEPVRGQAVPSPHFPGMDYEPSKRRLALEIEISERRIRLCQIAHEEAQAEAERLKAEAAASDNEANREKLAERIKATEVELAQLRVEYRLDNRGFAQQEAIRDAERMVTRTAGELEWWQKNLPKTRKELADAEQQEAIKRHNRAESIAQQRLLAG